MCNFRLAMGHTRVMGRFGMLFSAIFINVTRAMGRGHSALGGLSDLAWPNEFKE